jgi:DNA-binding transcriptional ArsR family regulator
VELCSPYFSHISLWLNVLYEVDGTCSSRRGNEEFIQHFARKTSREENTLENRRRWVDTIKTHLREMGIEVCTGFNWIRIGSSGVFS